jgi:RNA polymerase sigma factor (sigma-70 family)
MTRLGSLRDQANFRCWLFSIARNAALNRCKSRVRFRPLVSACGEDEAEPEIADPDRFASPEQSAEANAAAELVWEAAAGLEPSHALLVDLHLRRGMDCAEIAAELRVSRNYASVMLHRVKAPLADSVSALHVLRAGACPELDWELQESGGRSLTPRSRMLIREHAGHCRRCRVAWDLPLADGSGTRRGASPRVGEGLAAAA